MTEEDTPPPTFWDLITRLTSAENGLLPQLQEAVFGGMESTGGSSAFGSKPPIDTAAVDLLELIGHQAAEALATVDGRPTPYGKPWEYIEQWAKLAREDDVVRVHAPALTTDRQVFRQRIETTAYRHAERWVSQVEAFFDPPKVAQLLAPCPNCGVEKVARIIDGETIHTWALVMRRDRATNETIDVYCQHCTAEWPRRTLVTFAGEIGIDVEGAMQAALAT
ncbi:hypothetical protein [Frigoribacterium sp. RIT-PI-h]|uniref:DUF7341 domain-containing protein n=1 Tax=Frigoribacterium sp. RIT-PI-h TaxID=1690245 RepID=UPI0006B8FD9D|nr:hypothetical protein [Frigoribacterium sp. RIT-PI-h]KPG86501.1 hypothetical protein AEQ27_04085 [Frigoribacterium sp. RIT-PI-h]